jgi:hypothetical protein
MLPRVISQDLESLIQDIEEALTWLEQMGIQARRTRFGEYQRDLATVLEHRASGTVEKLPEIVPREKYRIAFIESARLVEVAKAFKRIPGPRFRQKVRLAAAGPAHPLDEKKSGSKARDFLFELSLAAFFRRRILPVIAWTQKDLIVRAAGATFLIECKRPQSKKGVKSSIKDATSQLVDHFRRYKAGVDRYGMVALDISVVANPQSAYLVVDSIGTLVREVDTLFERFHAEFESALRYHRDKRILGILLFAKILGYHTSENRHINIEKFGVCFHAQPSTFRGILADKFYDALIRQRRARLLE